MGMDEVLVAFAVNAARTDVRLPATELTTDIWDDNALPAWLRMLVPAVIALATIGTWDDTRLETALASDATDDARVLTAPRTDDADDARLVTAATTDVGADASSLRADTGELPDTRSAEMVLWRLLSRSTPEPVPREPKVTWPRADDAVAVNKCKVRLVCMMKKSRKKRGESATADKMWNGIKARPKW